MSGESKGWRSEAILALALVVHETDVGGPPISRTDTTGRSVDVYARLGHRAATLVSQASN
jgi:hypothetical protein